MRMAKCALWGARVFGFGTGAQSYASQATGELQLELVKDVAEILRVGELGWYRRVPFPHRHFHTRPSTMLAFHCLWISGRNEYPFTMRSHHELLKKQPLGNSQDLFKVLWGSQWHERLSYTPVSSMFD